MVYFEVTNDALDKCVAQLCAPLFASGQFLQGGHDESTTNATVTFVAWRGRVYALTCHHVIAGFFAESVTTNRQLVPSIHSGRVMQQLGFYLPSGDYRWAFQSCRKFPNSTEVDKPDVLDRLARQNAELPDIAIADITEMWPILVRHRSARVLNLDMWTQPDWSTTQPIWMAFGFPDTHKTQKEGKIEVPMPRVAVEVASLPTPERPQFRLVSTLEGDHGWRFSGLSGGPVFVVDRTRDLCAFVGIVNEGAPGSSAPQDNAETFIRGGDIVLSGYHVTPDTFGNWLQGLQYGVQFPTTYQIQLPQY